MLKPPEKWNDSAIRDFLSRMEYKHKGRNYP